VTHFEYLAVSFSVVLSFAVVRILSGISEVFARNRVYWPHAGWVSHQLIFIAYAWWIIWSYRAVSWNFFTYSAVLAGIGLVYYQTASLLPASPTSIESWQHHYLSVRRHFFGALTAWAIVILVNIRPRRPTAPSVPCRPNRDIVHRNCRILDRSRVGAPRTDRGHSCSVASSCGACPRTRNAQCTLTLPNTGLDSMRRSA